MTTQVKRCVLVAYSVEMANMRDYQLYTAGDRSGVGQLWPKPGWSGVEDTVATAGTFSPLLLPRG